MTSTEPLTLERLRNLLHDSTTSPAAAAAALAAERARVAGSSAAAHELLELELRWLSSQPEANDPALAALLGAVRADWLGLRVRGLVAHQPADAATLFELAETQAAAFSCGEHALAEQCERAIRAGVPGVVAGPELDEEAAERFAVLSTAIDDVTIDQQVQLLRRTGEVMGALAEHAQSKTCRRLARRLRRAADDRELARRLENLVGRRGVACIETTNFVLLLVVLGVLLVEATVALSPAQATALHWIDAGACSFFVLDFLFELALHPSRVSWFLRNAATDLLPAVPSVLFLMPGVDVPGVADNAVVLRSLRLLRVTWAARYVQALRPLLRSARLLLFLVRGLDGLTARFAQLLNREFVFVPAAADVNRAVQEDDARDLLFAALRREHELLGLLSVEQRRAVLEARARAALQTTSALGPSKGPRRLGMGAKDIPIDEAIEFLWALRPQDVGRWLRPADVQALDRVVRVLSAVPVRWLPIVRRLAVHPLPPDPTERIVQLGRRVAEWLEGWYGRMLFFADLHGIVTGPQILDRLASALVKASQRPAVRLLLFGGLFSVLRLFWVDNCLSKVVGLPLVALGGVCLVFLTLGHWLKRLAGQASEGYRLTSEAHFISQLERIKPRYERQDLTFLARRVFGDGRAARQAHAMLRPQIASTRTGVPVPDDDVPDHVRLEANRIALLYLHFLDGAPLHISDVKTTEQLLANQAIENLRLQFLRFGSRERKQLRKLKLDDGTLLSGPYLWFRFITESIAVEAAKRISGYNRYCVPIAEQATATPAQLSAMQGWLLRRRDPRGGRAIGEGKAQKTEVAYPTTEFTALDFLGGDPERDRHIALLFGDEVLEVVRLDRRTMVREIFGTRPVHHLPIQDRSFNPLRFYQRRLSHGRVLLAPLLLGWRFVRSIGWLILRVRQIVREVVDPELAMQRREIGTAPFAVALRKIHRMKAPGLLEAIRMRLQLDPVYSGAPAGWSAARPYAEEPEIERDLQFLHLREREAGGLREAAAAVRRDVEALHAAIGRLPDLGEAGTEDLALAGELAATCAWIANKDEVRTLLSAERWRTELLPRLLQRNERGSWWRAVGRFVGGWFFVHAVDRWLDRHGRDLPKSARRPLRCAYARDGAVRELLDAWSRLPAGTSPTAAAIEVLRTAYRNGSAVRRDLLALRAVQSMAVLDVRNYRDLVFHLGDYAADGEDPELGSALP
ncbi:MAG TPA: hypothetical protein VFZ65_19490 [Planctomycetota bacterium]|nr:hypothetical protein [Planctomycetota bacterium]